MGKLVIVLVLTVITGLLQIQATPSFCMTCSLDLENSVTCRMAQGNVSPSVFRPDGPRQCIPECFPKGSPDELRRW